LLVGAPWSGYSQNRKGDIYKCPISGSRNTCDKLNIQGSVSPVFVKIHKHHMVQQCNELIISLSSDSVSLPGTCGPLWVQRCGDQDFYPGICTKMSPLFQPQPAFSPAVQKCGSPMDIVIVLDGSNSIYPWEPMNEFVKKLITSLDIGRDKTRVSVLQYSVGVQVEFHLNDYSTKEDVFKAASRITQMYGHSTNTFNALQHACMFLFTETYGGRASAPNVMVVVTDGESHDNSIRDTAINICENNKVTRFGIAVLGYYNRNNIDTQNLIAEIKSIASSPTEKFFFNVSEEAALSNIAGTLGTRIFNIEGTGKGENFTMEMSQVGFSAHYSSQQDIMMLGAVGAYGWSGTVVHQSGTQVDILPSTAFETTLQDRNHSSLLGYSVSTLSDGYTEYYVAGAPRSNHSGQVIVYTMNAQKLVHVVDSERGKQIGSYFGSVLCPLDVDRDGVTDVLLVGAPMFMSELKREQGAVYIFSVTKVNYLFFCTICYLISFFGILNEHGLLIGPDPTENARFGMAISAVPDLDLDGYSDVVAGAPLEDNTRGVLYIFNGNKKTINKQFSQKIYGSKLDPLMQYFGRSLDSSKDLNGDTLLDVSVGGYGKVVQLWSRGVGSVTATVTFTPDKINILSKLCYIKGHKASCFNAKVCFTAAFKPKTPVGPLDISYTLTLDADLQATRVTSRGLFTKNHERFLTEREQIASVAVCQVYEVYVQEAPDFVNSVSLKVEIEQQSETANPVLDVYSTKTWEFFIPFTKDCGSDEVCVSDLVLNVKTLKQLSSLAPVLVTASDKELSFIVNVRNKKENAYNTHVVAMYSSNLYYSSVFPPTDKVSCTSTQAQTVTCQVGYPLLKTNEEVQFQINFDYNLEQLQNKAEVAFEAKSDGKEEKPADNTVSISVPVRYDAGIVLSRETNINFHVADSTIPVVKTVKTLNDIGPMFNFTVKVSTGILPVNLLYVYLNLPLMSKGGNNLLYVTSVATPNEGSVSCPDVGALADPFKILSGGTSHNVSFTEESFRGSDKLDCKMVKCQEIKCIIKDTQAISNYYINVHTRIWNGTFLTATYQTVELTASVNVETANPDLLIIGLKQLPVVLTVNKPGEKGDVPVGVIVGSVFGGLALLALAIGLLWK
ncbi:hypothetical protein NL108_009743, partial [Boleophthalmus pectinirostris]